MTRNALATLALLLLVGCTEQQQIRPDTAASANASRRQPRQVSEPSGGLREAPQGILEWRVELTTRGGDHNGERRTFLPGASFDATFFWSCKVGEKTEASALGYHSESLLLTCTGRDIPNLAAITGGTCLRGSPDPGGIAGSMSLVSQSENAMMVIFCTR